MTLVRPTSRRLAVGTTALLTVLLVILGMAARASATTPSTTTDPAQAAAGWLVQHFQNASHVAAPDGDHIDGSYQSGGTTVYYFDGGTTGEMVWALAAAKAGADKISAATAYLAAHLDEYTDITNSDGFGPSDGAVGKTALTAEIAGVSPTSFGGYNLLHTLKTDECPAQSNTCTPGSAANIYSSISESLVVLAEARAGGQYAPSTAALNYLLSLQCSDGGFKSDPTASTCVSDVDSTAYAVAALTAAGGHSAAVTAADAYLVSTRGSDGAWNDNTDSTGLAVSVLPAGQDVPSSRAWLAAQQVTTGPTVGSNSSRGALAFNGTYVELNSLLATSEGMLGLVPGANLATLTAAGAVTTTSVLALAGGTAATASVVQGGTDTVTAGGFSSGETVAVTLHSIPVSVGSTTADANGTATLSFTVPTTLAAGAHTIELDGATSGLSVSVPFTVTAAPVTTPPVRTTTGRTTSTALANTGLDGRQTSAEAILGLLLVLGGSGLLIAARRRPA